MFSAIEQIKKRRSVRTFDGQPIDESTKETIRNYMKDNKNPFDIPVEIKFLDAKENGLSCPVVSGTDLFVGGKIKMCQMQVLHSDIHLKYSYCLLSL